jgi:hypothetical protein
MKHMLAVNAMRSIGLSGYALDLGLLSDGRAALIEAKDGWALGYYRRDSGAPPPIGYTGQCSSVDYARLLHARWCQLSKPK